MQYCVKNPSSIYLLLLGVEVRAEITIRETIRIGSDLMTDQIADRGQDRSRPRYEQNFRRGNFRGNIKNYGRQNSKGESRDSYRNNSYDRSRDRSRKRSFLGIMAIIEVDVQATVDPGQDPELAQIGIEFIVISVGNVIILQGTVLLLGKKRRLNSFNNC